MPKFKISALHNLKASVIFGNTLYNAMQWRENEKKKTLQTGTNKE